ncbi:DnaJ C-terminal domain-containing protein [Acidiferrobacter sp.]|uniref:DnaJ C-terminal domain-containing protein n=1 Tax=Acidiferrobacter sp. TaxID=1872107 RepID=UPI00262D171B|nr:DnaJ C-terminal domain-containing protein [Acidiferrobacter sp.]
MHYRDYYQIMGIERTASAEDIKRAYRKLARRYHPDVSKEPKAEERFKEIGEAYEVLRDPEKRAAYDRLGSQWQPDQDFTPPPDWQQTAHGAGGAHVFHGEGFSDFFESLFGGGGRAAGGHHASRGADEVAHITVTLEEAFHGGTRALRLTIPRHDAKGHLVSETRTLNVRIPKGIQQGQQIRLAGQGSPGPGGPGDLYLDVAIAPHALYRADGRDLYLTAPVTPWEAALGTRLKVPTLAGTVELRLPENSQSGQKLRLKGRGMPGNPAGDQYVVIEIINPKVESEHARTLYQTMAHDLAFNPRAHWETAA